SSATTSWASPSPRPPPFCTWPSAQGQGWGLGRFTTGYGPSPLLGLAGWCGFSSSSPPPSCWASASSSSSRPRWPCPTWCPFWPGSLPTMERPLPPPLDALPEEAVRAFLARGEEVAAEEGEVLLEAQGPP